MRWLYMQILPLLIKFSFFYVSHSPGTVSNSFIKMIIMDNMILEGRHNDRFP
jgi:hypothetical protein